MPTPALQRQVDESTVYILISNHDIAYWAKDWDVALQPPVLNCQMWAKAETMPSMVDNIWVAKFNLIILQLNIQCF